MDLKQYLETYRSLIDGELERRLPSNKTEPKTLHKAMRYSVFSGGKRLRPAMVVWACTACGADARKAYAAACAVEMVHTYSLIHDDLPSMDNDDFRRGKPTCHKKFDEATAILAGDALLTQAFTTISNERTLYKNAKLGLRMIKELSSAIGSEGMVGGQAMDLDAQNRSKGMKRLSEINKLKTAKLFEVSTKLGAIAAGSNEKKIRLMADYGLFFGLAFQILDDIADGESYSDASSAEKAYKSAVILVEKSKSKLSAFGAKAARLIELADYILSRAE